MWLLFPASILSNKVYPSQKISHYCRSCYEKQNHYTVIIKNKRIKFDDLTAAKNNIFANIFYLHFPWVAAEKKKSVCCYSCCGIIFFCYSCCEDIILLLYIPRQYFYIIYWYGYWKYFYYNYYKSPSLFWVSSTLSLSLNYCYCCVC